MTNRHAVGIEGPACDETVGRRARGQHDRQELPGGGSRLPPGGGQQGKNGSGSSPLWGAGLVLDTAVALAKSTEIAARGSRVWNAAVFAYAWTGIECLFDDYRARLATRSVVGMMQPHEGRLPRVLADFSKRNAILGRIWIQIAQDVSHPVQQRVLLASEGLFPRS